MATMGAKRISRVGIRRSKSGLTLIEMVVAIALLAIVAVLMSGTIVYTFKTAFYSSSKTTTSFLTIGELVKRVSGDENSYDLAVVDPIEPEAGSMILNFNGISVPVTIEGNYYTATNRDQLLNGSTPQSYKAFVP